jgi:hypothetical protein
MHTGFIRCAKFTHSSLRGAFIVLVEPDSKSDQAQPVLDPDYERARLVLDEQARVWSAAARRLIWLTSLALFVVVAVGAGFLLF